ADRDLALPPAPLRPRRRGRDPLARDGAPLSPHAAPAVGPQRPLQARSGAARHPRLPLERLSAEPHAAPPLRLRVPSLQPHGLPQAPPPAAHARLRSLLPHPRRRRLGLP